MVREVTFADSEQTLHAGLEFVVNPDTTHSVVDSRVDHHWVVVVFAVDGVSEFAWVHVGDFFIHVDEVAVALTNHVDTEAVDSFREVEEHSLTSVVHTEALVATFLSGA